MSTPYYEIKLNYEFLSSSDDPNGVINLTVDKEINTAGSCSFVILPSCSRYSEIKRWTSYIDVEMRGFNVFRGRITEISSDLYNQLSITCEGALAYLNDFYCRVDSSFSYLYRDLDRIWTGDTNNIWPSWAEQSDVERVAGRPPKNILLAYAWGNDQSGMIEPDYDGANMVPYTALTRGSINHSTGEIVYGGFQYYVCTDYISTEDGVRYTFAPTEFYTRDPEYAHTVYVAEYSGTLAHPIFQRVVEHTAWNAWYNGGRIIRFYARSPRMWLAAESDVENETESDANKIVTFSDYLSERALDKRGMMMRVKVYNQTSYLHILHPKRNWKPKIFSFTDNIISLSGASPSMDGVYSILFATFNGKVSTDPVYGGHIEYEIPGAIERFGRIYHAVDFNQDPVPADESSSAYKAIIKKLKQYADLYNPLLSNTITLNGIDPFLFDDGSGEPVDVGDCVSVESSPHNISMTKLCLSMKLDFQNPQNNEYTIGDFVKDGEDNKLKSLTASFAKEKKKKK